VSASLQADGPVSAWGQESMLQSCALGSLQLQSDEHAISWALIAISSSVVTRTTETMTGWHPDG
jgi:hypothetical protein